jgi:transcriptional regulator
MYVPAQFKEDRISVLHDAIRGIAFGTLVTIGTDGMTANHVPMLIDAEPKPFGMLCGHVARGNPQWRTAQPQTEALAIFTGPQSYITPSWYPTKQETGKVVPTWNYIAVHAYGTLRFSDDPAQIRAHVTKLTATHEAGRAKPWAVSDAPEDYLRAMIAAIIGFEFTITRLEGKWKMSQNRSPSERAGVVDGLRRQDATEIADIVAARNEPDAG